MIAYNNQWLFNKYSRAQADEALDHECISQEAHNTIYDSSPVGFYTPNIWGRVGIALLTLTAASFSLSLFGLLFQAFDHAAGALIFAGLAVYTALEIMVINGLKHYNSGADNVLIVLTAVLLISGIGLGLSDGQDNHNLFISLCAALVCTYLTARFADTVMGIMAAAAWLSLLFFTCTELGNTTRALAPFAIMAGAFGIYLFSVYTAGLYRWLLYRSCLRGIAVAALVMLYLAGNYYIVQQAANAMSHDYARIQAPLGFGWFFWAWTILVPFVYCGIGIKKKNITLIRTGLILTSVMVLTYRHYFSLITPDKAMIIGGSILSLGAYALIRYLHTPKHGFTFAKDKHISERRQLHQSITEHVMNKVSDKLQHGDSDWS